MTTETIAAHRFRRLSARLPAAFLVAAVVLAATAVPLLACDIGVAVSSASGAVGDNATITVTVHQTHRNCTVPIDETQIRLTGMSLVSETPWAHVSTLDYEKELVVELAAVGDGRVDVVRTCPKGGGQAFAVVSIGPAGNSDSGVQPATADGQIAETDAEAVAPPSPAPETPALPAPDETAADAPSAVADAGTSPWLQSLWEALTQPYILVLLALMAAGTVYLLRGSRRARPFAMLISVGFLGFYVGGCPCPLGALQNVFIQAGDVAEHMTAYVQFGAVVLVTLLFGRVFCGWACPLGAVQFFLFRRERGKKGGRLEIPREQHNILRWAKYGVLLVLIVLVFLTGRPVFEDIDPFRVLFNLDFRWGVPLAFLVALLVASVAIGFPFCKYLCPLGALLGLLQPLSLFKLRFSDTCTNCKLCSTTSCDYGAIEQGRDGPVINQRECVRCGECMSGCPRNAIALTVKRR